VRILFVSGLLAVAALSSAATGGSAPKDWTTRPALPIADGWILRADNFLTDQAAEAQRRQGRLAGPPVDFLCSRASANEIHCDVAGRAGPSPGQFIRGYYDAFRRVADCTALAFRVNSDGSLDTLSGADTLDARNCSPTKHLKVPASVVDTLRKAYPKARCGFDAKAASCLFPRDCVYTSATSCEPARYNLEVRVTRPSRCRLTFALFRTYDFTRGFVLRSPYTTQDVKPLAFRALC
jgi:hypothetical protein